MKVSEYLTRDEMKYFTRRSNRRGAWLVLKNWLIIAAIFTCVALWTNPLSIVIAIFLLGGRQIGVSVLMHEAGHKTLFETPKLNGLIGQWLGAYPVLGDCTAYAASHREHHRNAGTEADPDLPNYQSYPISKASFYRKMSRDITGRTGIKQLAGLFTGKGGSLLMAEGESSNALWQGLAANGLFFLVLFFCGIGELYILWVAAYLTSYPLIARIRQVAEHGAVADLYDVDPRLHTRTIIPRWFEEGVICANDVNYHLEHHLLPSVPIYKLKELHRLLNKKGFYKDHPQAIVHGYGDVIRQAVPELA